MNIKMVALDLDGTLLNSEGEISKFNRDIIHSLEAKGIKVILCTGRPYLAMKRFRKDLDLKNEVICFNGAMIVDSNESPIYSTCVDPSISRDLVSLGVDNNVYFQGFIGDRWLVPSVTKTTLDYSKRGNLKYEVSDFLLDSDLDFTKLLYIDEPQKIKAIAKKIETQFKDKLYFAFSNERYLEVLNINSSKAKALEVLLNKYGYTNENLLTMGDGYNDLEMLEYAKIGVIMDNAPKELKDRFDHFAPDHKEDGVGVYLQKFFNL